MTVFVVFRVTHPDKLGAAIEEAFGDNQFSLGTNEWLVSWPGTAKEVSEKIGLVGGANGNGIVVPVASYWGRAPADVWDWMKTKSEATGGG